MRITIVMGFFLPVPAAAGGAIEKTWQRLAVEIARRGHEVTVVSRCWRDWPDDEVRDGVRHIRLPGFSLHAKLWRNLLSDFCWSLRVQRRLPAADIVALNTISLACWLGTLSPRTGRVVAMPGRLPKGQFRFYRKLARILVPSDQVREAVITERPSFAPLVRTIGYPIDWTALNQARQPRNQVVTIGFIGRLNREKGLHLLIAALQRLSQLPLPAWRAVICGPSEVAQGGSGDDYLQDLKKHAPAQVEFLKPIFIPAELHTLYGRLDIFCYPSLAIKGETFGVAVAEAMAAGATPIVSDLPCFRDFIKSGKNGLVFDAFAPTAIDQLTTHLSTLIRDPACRRGLAVAATAAVQRYDFPRYVDGLLADFAQLTASTASASYPL